MKDKIKIGQIWRHKRTHESFLITCVPAQDNRVTILPVEEKDESWSFYYSKNSLISYYYLVADIHPNEIWKELCQNETPA